MKFFLVDHLLALHAGQSITMAKNVTMAEEYLADHFPQFPVLPGVMMLEAAVQAAAWLVRTTENFAHSIVVLREARGVRYGTFVPPGKTLVMNVEALSIAAAVSEFKIKGTVDGANAIQARIALAHLNLKDTNAAMEPVDAAVLKAQRERWEMLLARSAPAIG